MKLPFDKELHPLASPCIVQPLCSNNKQGETEMGLDQLQQIIRIILFAIAGYFLGEGAVETEVVQGAIGGVIAIVTFVWWKVWDGKRPDSSRT